MHGITARRIPRAEIEGAKSRKIEYFHSLTAWERENKNIRAAVSIVAEEFADPAFDGLPEIEEKIAIDEDGREIGEEPPGKD